MNVTGILWTLYPLLGFLAFIEFFVGFAHIFFCLPFFVFALPILSGIIASITSVYALLLHNPNRTELLLQLLSSLLAFGLFLISATETNCLKTLRSESSETSVCAGILNRTISSQVKCSIVLDNFQDTFFAQIGKAKALLFGADSEIVASTAFQAPLVSRNDSKTEVPGHDTRFALLNAKRESMRIAIASILTFTSLIHLIAGTILTFYSAIMNNFHLSTPHWQTIIGILTLLFSYVYHAYCCVFFYTFTVTAIAIFCLIQTTVPWHFPARTAQRQLFSILGAALSTILLCLTSFGFYCWSNRSLVPWKFDPDATNLIDSKLFWNLTEQKMRGDMIGIFRYCHKPERLYMICERTLQFSTPYIFWTQEQVESEEEIVQILIYIFLTINGFIHFVLFIRDAFSV